MIDLLRRLQVSARCRKGSLPDSICRYARLFEHSFRRDTPLEEVRFVVFDTETSGFDITSDRIISIGAVGMKGSKIDIADSFEVLIRQEGVGKKDAVAVHGLLKRDINRGLEEEEAACRFLDYLGKGVIVAHHADFDIAMVSRVLSQRFGLKLFNEALDTASYAKRLEKGPYYNLAHKGGEYRLDNLLNRYGIRPHDRDRKSVV